MALGLLFDPLLGLSLLPAGASCLVTGLHLRNLAGGHTPTDLHIPRRLSAPCLLLLFAAALAASQLHPAASPQGKPGPSPF